MDSNPADLPAGELLNLAAVDADANLETEPAHRIDDRPTGANRASRPVEDGEEAVPGGVKVAALVPLELRANGGVMAL